MAYHQHPSSQCSGPTTDTPGCQLPVPGTEASLVKDLPVSNIGHEDLKTSGPWDDSQTRTLLGCYPEVEGVTKGSDTLSKDFWLKISGLMKTKGILKTWFECKEKWKSLNRTYKSNLEKKTKQEKVLLHGCISILCMILCIKNRRFNQ
ncbi:uncharacterized protein LOC122506087 [Leptopilina heterotoma]|uniref:uncharacterized protein LOC122506087 n=1 Tax=Leptopilina heterotoma TaxID=63436 RepID=UPI001CA89CAE|nr:uncharacterized protein LOC122506087 [Leptopilina heterotoma]